MRWGSQKTEAGRSEGRLSRGVKNCLLPIKSRRGSGIGENWRALKKNWGGEGGGGEIGSSEVLR